MNLQLQAIQVTGCATLHHNCTILTFLLLCRKCHASSQSHLECSTSIGPHHPHYRGGAGGGVRTMTTLILHCLAYLKRTLLLSCFSYDISCSSSLWQQRSYAYIYVLRMGEVLHTHSPQLLIRSSLVLWQFPQHMKHILLVLNTAHISTQVVRSQQALVAEMPVRRLLVKCSYFMSLVTQC